MEGCSIMTGRKLYCTPAFRKDALLLFLMESNSIDETQDAAELRQRKGKAVDTRVSPKWTDANIAALIEACVKEVRAENRPGDAFDHIGWMHIVEDFKLQTGNNYTKQQLKNRLDTLKNEWREWTILNRGETGLGWDNIRQTVLAEPEWWERKIQETPSVAKFRLKGPLLKEQQAELFDGVVALGLRSFAPSSGNIPFLEVFPEGDEGSGETEPDVIVSPVTNIASTPLEYEIANDTNQGRSSVNITKKNKRLRLTEGIAKSLDTIAVNGRMRLEARAKLTSDDIDKCLASLHAHPGILHGSQLWFFAVELFADPIQRSLYMGIPTDALRLQWLEEKLARHKIQNPSLYTQFDPVL